MSYEGRNFVVIQLRELCYFGSYCFVFFACFCLPLILMHDVTLWSKHKIRKNKTPPITTLLRCYSHVMWCYMFRYLFFLQNLPKAVQNTHSRVLLETSAVYCDIIFAFYITRNLWICSTSHWSTLINKRHDKILSFNEG